MQWLRLFALPAICLATQSGGGGGSVEDGNGENEKGEALNEFQKALQVLQDGMKHPAGFNAHWNGMEEAMKQLVGVKKQEERTKKTPTWKPKHLKDEDLYNYVAKIKQKMAADEKEATSKQKATEMKADVLAKFKALQLKRQRIEEVMETMVTLVDKLDEAKHNLDVAEDTARDAKATAAKEFSDAMAARRKVIKAVLQKLPAGSTLTVDDVLSYLEKYDNTAEIVPQWAQDMSSTSSNIAICSAVVFITSVIAVALRFKNGSACTGPTEYDGEKLLESA